MFGIDGGEFVVLALLALFLLGPERLPGLAKQAARALHDVRRWAERTRGDIGRELGPEFENFDLADLNPRKFVQKHLLDPLVDDDDELTPRTYGSSALASRTGDDPAVSLEKGPAPGGAELAGLPSRTVALHELPAGGGADGDAAELVGARLGPDLTTDVFADPVPASSPWGGAQAAGVLEVPSWADTASARVDLPNAEDRYPDMDPDLEPDLDSRPDQESDVDVDESMAWSRSYYVAPPIDLDAT